MKLRLKHEERRHVVCESGESKRQTLRRRWLAVNHRSKALTAQRAYEKGSSSIICLGLRFAYEFAYAT